MISESLIERFAQAIAHEEGFFADTRGGKSDVPERAHNPGDLTDDGDIGNGFIQTSGPNGAKITIYSTDADGWNALFRKVRRMLSGASAVYVLSLTMEQVGIKYSGDPNWGPNVAARVTPVGALTVTGATTLAEIAQADLQAQGTENAT